jgi:hypothetical protein
MKAMKPIDPKTKPPIKFAGLMSNMSILAAKYGPDLPDQGTAISRSPTAVWKPPLLEIPRKIDIET